MAREERHSLLQLRTLALIALVVALMLVIAISTGFASRGFLPVTNVMVQILATEMPYPTVTPVPTKEGLIDLSSLRGEVVARWSSEQPVTSFQVTAYEIEELTLPHPIEVVANGQTLNVQKAWKISITRSEPFQVTSLGYRIWIDDVSVPAREEPPGLVGFVFDPSLLREGARIGISPSDFIDLRQKLPGGLDLQKNPTP